MNHPLRPRPAQWPPPRASSAVGRAARKTTCPENTHHAAPQSPPRSAARKHCLRLSRRRLLRHISRSQPTGVPRTVRSSGEDRKGDKDSPRRRVLVRSAGSSSRHPTGSGTTKPEALSRNLHGRWLAQSRAGGSARPGTGSRGMYSFPLAAAARRRGGGGGGGDGRVVCPDGRSVPLTWPGALFGDDYRC